MEKLIDEYQVEPGEPGCSPGMGRYGVEIRFPGDISPAFPYLNAVLEDTWYDQQNQVLLASGEGKRYAFRPDEIKVAGIQDLADGALVAREVVNRVNQVWQERDSITPCFSERKVPTTVAIYQLLPKTNCKQCGFPTCLVFAAQVREEPALLEKCLPLAGPAREQIKALFSPPQAIP